MPLASVFSGPGLVAIAAVAGASFLLAQRSWRWAVVLVVAADALSWSWAGWLKEIGNVVYWGGAVGVSVALLLLARSSRLARVLLITAALATAAVLATAAWSFEPHVTIRTAGTFGSALSVVAFAVARALAEPDGSGRLARALAVLTPGALVLSVLLIAVEHTKAVAEGGGVSGFLNGPNSLGLFLALGLGFLLALPAVERGTAALVVSIGAVAFAVTLSGSRTGMLAALLAFLAYEVGLRHWRRLAVVAAAGVAAGAVAAVAVPDVPTFGRPLSVDPSAPQATHIFTGRAAGQSLFGSLTGGRDEAWREAVRLLDKRPVLGSGFGTGTEIFEHDGVRGHFHYFVGAFDAHANVHDAYLQELLELGLPAGLLFIVPALASLVLVLLALRRGWSSPGEAAFGASAVAAFVCAVFESVLAGFGAMTLLAWLSLAMLIVPALQRRLLAREEALPANDPRSPAYRLT